MTRPGQLPRWARQVRVVLMKELVDSFRDKRALASILLSILVGPLITGFMMNRIADRQKDADDVRIPIVGARNAPALVQWLSQQSGVSIATGPSDPEQAVRDQSEYVVLVVPGRTTSRTSVRRGRPASRSSPTAPAPTPTVRWSACSACWRSTAPRSARCA